MKWILSVVFCAAVTLVAQQVQVDHALDMSTQPRTPHNPDHPFLPKPFEELVSLTDQPPAKAQLLLRLLPLEQGSSRWGEGFVYQLLIQNTGATTVMLPWSADEEAFKQEDGKRVPRGYRRASFTLEVQDAEHKALGYLDGASLYGSEEVKGSLLALAPGKTARITIPGRWATPTTARRTIDDASSKGPVFWVATLSLPAEGLNSVHSTNRLSFSRQQ